MPAAQVFPSESTEPVSLVGDWRALPTANWVRIHDRFTETVRCSELDNESQLLQELSGDREQELRKSLDENLSKLVGVAFDIFAGVVNPWPPLEGLSTQGEKEIKDIVMERCEKFILDNTSNSQQISVLRFRALHFIDERLRALRALH